MMPLAARFRPEVARAVAARRQLVPRIVAWADRHRAPHPRTGARPLAWVHAASAGEAQHAVPLLELFRARRPQWQLFVSFFSPSALPLVASLAVDGYDYLPFDRPADVGALVSALDPSLLIFAQADVWPALTAEAARRNVRLALVSAAVSEQSRRLWWPVRRALHSTYARLDAVGAATREDASRLRLLGAERPMVTGDLRWDRCVALAARGLADEWVRALAGPRPALVAGSTWANDESVLLDAFSRVRRQHPGARLIVVPHQPERHHVERLRARAEARGFESPVVTERPRPLAGCDLTIVARVGILAPLYGLAVAAYVGGGFGPGKVHSTVEPAAHGVPIAVGPGWRSSRDARRLREVGALLSLPRRDAATALGRWWAECLDGPEQAKAAGERARALVAGGTGATGRTMRMLDPLLDAVVLDPRR